MANLRAYISRGFTLIELIITIVLIGLLAAVGTTMISDSFDTTYMVNATESSSAKARYALERIEREVREVKRAGSEFCFNTLANPATTLTFKKPATNSTDTASCATGVTEVVVNLAGSTISLASGGATATTLSDDVTGFEMRFLTIDNTPTTSKADVRFVQISLTVKNAIGIANVERTRIALRNAP